MIRILVATDAWRPQVNGVVHSLEAMAKAAGALGAEVRFLTPDGFRSFPLPTYNEIRLALATPGAVRARVEAEHAASWPIDHIHIATEGPIGMATRRFCLRAGRVFTTSFHTRFPEYLAARTMLPARTTKGIAYAWLRRFHNAAAGVMVSTPSLERELRERGFGRLMTWSRGVDCDLFRPRETSVLDLPRPIFLNVGRIAVEKNIKAFLDLDLPGSKVLVGDGPARASLEKAHPEAHFLGLQKGEDLAAIYASADVFVFPSLTDTFGMVLLEAIACGTPVAAFPVPGPNDVIGGSTAGALDPDLRTACLRALALSRADARAHALTFTWRESARQFVDNVVGANPVVQETVLGEKRKFLRYRQRVQRG